MTEYMLSVWLNGDATDASPKEPAGTPVEDFNNELRAEGSWVFGAGLHPIETATTVTVKGVVTDGPFSETKEYLGGFWVVKAEDLDAAIALSVRAAAACGAPVEIRPVDGASE